MRYCEECGAKLEEDALFCEECGAKQTPNTDETVEQEMDNNRLEASQNNKNGKKSTAVFLGVLGVIIAVIVAAYFVISGGQGDENQEKAENTENTTLFDSLSWGEPDANIEIIGSIKLTDYRGKAIKNAIENSYTIEDIQGAKDKDKIYICYTFSDKSDSYDAVISRNEDSDVVMEELFKNSKKLSDKKMDEFCKKTFMKEGSEQVDDESEKKEADSQENATATPMPAAQPTAAPTAPPTAVPTVEPTVAAQEDYAIKYSYLIDSWYQGSSAGFEITIKGISGNEVLLNISYYDYDIFVDTGNVIGYIDSGKINFEFDLGDVAGSKGSGIIYIPDMGNNSLLFEIVSCNPYSPQNVGLGKEYLNTYGIQQAERSNPNVN